MYFVCFVVQPIRVHSCPFVVLFFLFVYFVCFVVQSIRVHSCPFVVLFFLFVYFVPIRGSVFSFRVFRVFRGSIHSRRFVVPRPVSAKNFPGNVGDDLFSVDLFLQLLLETKSYR